MDLMLFDIVGLDYSITAMITLIHNIDIPRITIAKNIKIMID
jgi:hypothetical protein